MSTVIDGFPLSPQQRRGCLLSDDGDRFRRRARCQILVTGPLDVARLRQAVADTVRTQEILRTAFTPCPGLLFPLQVIAEPRDFAPRWSADRDLSGLSEHQRQVAIDSMYEAAATRPPGGGADDPLLELALAKLDDERHVLVVGLPALCSDAAGLTALLRAFGRRYADLRQSGEPPQYADVATWLNDVLESAEAQQHAASWRDRTNRLMELGRAPFERPAAAPPESQQAGSVEVPLTPDTAAALAAVARQWQVPVSSLLLTAWQSLLWRHTGHAGVAFTAAGRDIEQLADVIGPLSRQLPAPIDIDGREPFHVLLRRVHATVRECVDEQNYFSWDGRSGVGGNDAGRFFPVGYEFDQLPVPYAEGGVGWEISRRHADVDRHALRLAVVQHVTGMSAGIEFDPARFRAEDVTLLADQLRTLLANVIEDYAVPVEQLGLLGADERERLVTAFNATAAAPPERTFAELFSAQAARTPDAQAVVSGSGTLSYAELETRSSRLAHRLRSLGTGPETPVAILMERSAELLVAVLGVLKAGGAFIPLDPGHPPQRLASLLRDARPHVVLVQPGMATRWAEPPWGRHHTEVLPLDEAGACLAGESSGDEAEPSPPSPAPDQIAYVIYTSGSTGRPKGVQVTHRGLANYLTWATDAYDVAGGDGALVDGPVSVDLVITGLLSPLLAGRTVVLVPGGQPVGRLADTLLTGDRYSLAKVTPLALDLLSSDPDGVEAARRTRAFVIGGENLTAGTVAFYREHAPDTTLVNEYGPTETVVGCCVHTVGPESPVTGSIPIGRPIANMRLYVLDPALRPVPAGVPGEIYIGGWGVARGYLDRPGLTAERFVPDPFSTTPGGRLYRTGDLGRFRSDGDLEYLGRNDHQVKIRGYRVEPGEVEATLRDHSGVREAVVIAHEFGPDDRRLIAYVVTAEPMAADTLRRFLAERLPEHMVPSTFIPMDELPVSASGKVDRSELPDPGSNRNGVVGEPVAPRTPLEREVADLFVEVLHLDEVGVDDDFFELGGTSVLLVQLNNRLAGTYGLDRSMTQILRTPNVAETAQMIAMARQNGRDSVLASGVALAALDAHLDESIAVEYGPAVSQQGAR
jgi:amino acid adenylation domain-containing protein